MDNKARTEAVILLLIPLALISMISNGFLAKPVLEYHLSTPLDYNGTIDFDSELISVSFFVKNMGRSSSRLIMKVRMYNMSVMDQNKYDFHTDEDFSEIFIPIRSYIENEEVVVRELSFNASKEADYGLIIYYLDYLSFRDPITGFYESFGIHSPKKPTALLLKNIGNGVFKRVTSKTN